MEITKISDEELLLEIQRRFEEKSASIAEMEFMTKKLLQLNEEAKKAEKTQSEFLSLIKNEFNNPLTTLLELSKNLVEKRNPEKAEEISSMLREELLTLEFELSNIFCTTEIEAGEIGNHYTKIQFAEIFEEVKEKLYYVIMNKQLKLELEILTPSVLITDLDKLSMVMINLISNACEFSYPEKAVYVRLMERDGRFCIEVEDFGEGIHVDSQKMVYNRFAQFHKGFTRSNSGLGLGLSVVQAYVEALDGSISFNSEDGHTVFWVYLPMLEENALGEGFGTDEFFFDDFSDTASDDTIDM